MGRILCIVSNDKVEVMHRSRYCIYCQSSPGNEVVRREGFLSDQDFQKSTAKHYSTKSEIIYSPRKDA